MKTKTKNYSKPNTTNPLDSQKILRNARAIITAEAHALTGLVDQLNLQFVKAVALLLQCKGRVVVAGMGKSGLVGQKISATLASTGTPSLFLHAAEAVHGDLGRISNDDVVLALSNSGESEEIVRLLKPVKDFGVPLIAMTGNRHSPLARYGTVVLDIGNISEACPMGLVPTASTTAMMVLGDALAMALFDCRGLNREDYARFHPGGALGRKFLKVREVMRQGKENPLVYHNAKLKEVIAVMTQTPGKPGSAIVVDRHHKLLGIFTDGDLRRLVEHQTLDGTVPIQKVMHTSPRCVQESQLLTEAAQLLRQHKIDQVPVVNRFGKVVGLLDVQDVLSTKVT